jgi:hypothetical protein
MSPKYGRTAMNMKLYSQEGVVELTKSSYNDTSDKELFQKHYNNKKVIL